jgi:hypothetical protein
MIGLIEHNISERGAKVNHNLERALSVFRKLTKDL